MYRQALELIIKANTFKYITNEKEQKEYLKLVGHNLRYSFEVFQMNIDNLRELQKNDNVKWIKKFLSDITEIDKESDVFRYPFSNSGKKYFEKVKRINLKCVKINFNTAYEILKDLYIGRNILNIKYRAYKPKFL